MPLPHHRYVAEDTGALDGPIGLALLGRALTTPGLPVAAVGIIALSVLILRDVVGLLAAILTFGVVGFIGGAVLVGLLTAVLAFGVMGLIRAAVLAGLLVAVLALGVVSLARAIVLVGLLIAVLALGIMGLARAIVLARMICFVGIVSVTAMVRTIGLGVVATMLAVIGAIGLGVVPAVLTVIGAVSLLSVVAAALGGMVGATLLLGVAVFVAVGIHRLFEVAIVLGRGMALVPIDAVMRFLGVAGFAGMA